MEQLPNKDIERMITFIKHEADEKIKEIELKGIQDYNTQKAHHIKAELDKTEIEFSIRKKTLGCKKLKSESDIINKYNMLYVEKKNEILNEVFVKLENHIKDKDISEQLIQETTDKFVGRNYTVMCNKKDKKIIKKVLGNIEVREMPEEGLGGIILISSDNNVLIDNSYRSRIDSLRTYYLSEVCNSIFK